MRKLSKEEIAHARKQRAMQRIAREFLKAIHDRVSLCLILEDVDGLGRLVTQMDILMGYEVMKTLRDKGMSEEINKLADKAGLKK